MFAFLIAYLIKMNLAIERIWLSNFQADSLFLFIPLPPPPNASAQGRWRYVLFRVQ